MKTLICVMALACCAAAQQPAVDLGTLGWLAGSWEQKRGETVMEEHWTKPAAGKMIGMARTVSKGTRVSFEYLRIEQRGTSLVYVAQPGGRPPTEFALAKATDTELVFENPQHDFPTRIIYRRNADGSVTARIEGGPAEKPKGMNFEFTRMK